MSDLVDSLQLIFINTTEGGLARQQWLRTLQAIRTLPTVKQMA